MPGSARRSRLVSGCGAVLLIVASCGDDGAPRIEHDGGEGSGPMSPDGAGATGGAGAGGSSAGSGGLSTSNGSANDEPCTSAGKPCSTPGTTCTYGDDCGSSDFRCESGQWVHVGGTGCGRLPVPCAVGPEEMDPCKGNEVCDPDGDCRDVLECVSGQWKRYRICTPEFCATEPVDGEPCDDPGHQCPQPCVPGELTYFCQTTGWRVGGQCAI